MAIVLEHRPVGSLSHLVRQAYERIVSAWQRYRAERELESMSFDQRKDIGFRSSDKIAR
jgi:uncharacterized protein YjiS (DUF1127 family)